MKCAWYEYHSLELINWKWPRAVNQYTDSGLNNVELDIINTGVMTYFEGLQLTGILISFVRLYRISMLVTIWLVYAQCNNRDSKLICLIKYYLLLTLNSNSWTPLCLIFKCHFGKENSCDENMTTLLISILLCCFIATDKCYKIMIGKCNFLPTKSYLTQQLSVLHEKCKNRHSSVGVYQTPTRSSGFVDAIPLILNFKRR